MNREEIAETVGYYFGLQLASNMRVFAPNASVAEGYGMAINELRRKLDAEMKTVEASLPPGTIDNWPDPVTQTKSRD